VSQVCAILFTVLISIHIALAQSVPPPETAAMKSDRVTDSLRGPVKSCTEETTTPNFSDPGSAAHHSEHTTVYDPEGRRQMSRSRYTDSPEWSTHYDYSPSGQLLRISFGTEGNPPSETTYSYDQQGRLQEVRMNDGKPPISFRYDQHGRKTKIQTSRSEDYRPGVATALGPFEGLDMVAANLPGGGPASTIYDEQDRPIEVQVRNVAGELVNRGARVYDSAGNVIADKQTLENLTAQFPAEEVAKLVQQSRLSTDQLKNEMQAQFTKLMGGRSDGYLVAYSYDSQGRLSHTSRKIFNHEDEIETTYNEQGDKVSEVTRRTHPDPNAPSLGTSYSEVRYSCQHDQHGNWTEKTIYYRSSPDAEFQPSTVINRTLTYY
jgi:hypothetical protein